jgi:hypothetical protein
MNVFKDMVIILKNDNYTFELRFIDINDYDNEIVVYSHIRYPELKRGFVGELIYHGRGFNITTDEDIKMDVDSYKDVLLRTVQCSSADVDGTIEWKYVFLKE